MSGISARDARMPPELEAMLISLATGRPLDCTELQKIAHENDLDIS